MELAMHDSGDEMEKPKEMLASVFGKFKNNDKNDRDSSSSSDSPSSKRKAKRY